MLSAVNGAERLKSILKSTSTTSNRIRHYHQTAAALSRECAGCVRLAIAQSTLGLLCSMLYYILCFLCFMIIENSRKPLKRELESTQNCPLFQFD